jgi:carbonic anhydrase
MHTCQAAILHCIDFRFQEAIDKFMAERQLNGSCDRIGIAGGVRNLKEVSNELSISENLHHIKDIYLVNHQDCGAYGSQVSAEAEKELQIHTQDLLTAKKIIKKKYPQVTIHTYFLTLEKEFVEIN